MPGAVEIAEAVEDAARVVVRQPIVNRSLSLLGMVAVALVAAPLLIILTLLWGFIALPVIGLVLPPEAETEALTLLITFGPPLVIVFLLLRWGLVHLPPNVRRYLTS